MSFRVFLALVFLSNVFLVSKDKEFDKFFCQILQDNNKKT